MSFRGTHIKSKRKYVGTVNTKFGVVAKYSWDGEDRIQEWMIKGCLDFTEMFSLLAGGVAQVVECMPSMSKAVGSSPSKQKRETKNK
jgi:hypothetical protein